MIVDSVQFYIVYLNCIKKIPINILAIFAQISLFPYNCFFFFNYKLYSLRRIYLHILIQSRLSRIRYAMYIYGSLLIKKIDCLINFI